MKIEFSEKIKARIKKNVSARFGNSNQTILLVSIGNMGFLFSKASNLECNLISPCLVQFITNNQSIREINSFFKLTGIENPEDYIHLSEQKYVKKGEKEIYYKKGQKRKMEEIELTFKLNNKTYTDLFYIDENLDNHLMEGKRIVGLLRRDF
ncbi:hypothetical protein [Dysgonomonas sp. BGC7]|uniref:hypothetical protein n=1 Tax=Dysgonomonas sp. BGC7 TaxID=1658008 RepID=UPI000682E482|nr:hypothetical protein [Dysgonomonas sp. BGC7]MBD8388845.1 hypothetical protein [Dysgonomonas sp. BGC7]